MPRLIDRSSPLQRDVLTNQYSPSGVREPLDEDGKKSTRGRWSRKGQGSRERERESGGTEEDGGNVEGALSGSVVRQLEVSVCVCVCVGVGVHALIVYKYTCVSVQR